MAGLFGLFDYTKEGPGVDPDAPPKGPVAVFFGVLGRKFWKICTISIMYSVFSIPSLVLAFFVSNVLYSSFLPLLTIENMTEVFKGVQLGEGVTPEQLSALFFLIMTLIFTYLITGLGYVVVGPTQAGVTYLLRNYSREEHAFVWSDFVEHARKNLKQSLAVSFLTLLAVVTVPVAIRFYSDSIGNNILRLLLVSFLTIAGVIFTIMLMYIYQMMVTFELTVRQLLKNAFLFSILRLPFNVLAVIGQLFIIGLIPALIMYMLGGLGVFISALYMILFGYGANLLLVNFFVNRQVMRFMIRPMEESQEPVDDYVYAEDDYDVELIPDDREEKDEGTAESGDDAIGLPEPNHSPA
ncbi:MAG: DUF624 domain-containing protein [Bacillota bacterium]|nr:DUF624 domain-containing protein [Bacillota bacterium]